MRVPTSVAEAAALVAGAVHGVDLSRAVAVEGGWDSFVLDTGEWIFRFPRRPEVETALRAEIATLPRLAPALPVAIPRFEHVVAAPVLFAGYRKIEGAALTGREGPTVARDLARFLRALHAFPAREAPLPFYDHGRWRARHEEMFERFRPGVGPLLARRERALAEQMFDDFLATPFDFVPSVVHYDLGPAHLLAREGRLAGVIDWGDAVVGDPAVDLAWALHGSGFGDVVLEEYGATAGERERALLYHRLGPWHEVVHGQETGDDAWIETGLAGVRDRLPPEPGAGR